MTKLNWDDMLGGSFVKLSPGIPTKLRLANWRPQTAYKDEKGAIKPGIEFDCVEQDGKVLTGEEIKSYIITAIKALVKLKPIIIRAEAANKNEIFVQVLRAGEGRQTVYEVVDLTGQTTIKEEQIA